MKITQVTIRQPDDWHVHLRDGDILSAVVPFTARAFWRAMVMPNLAKPVTTAEAAKAYRYRIVSALPRNSHFQPLMTCYLCDDTDPADLRHGFEAGIFNAAKLYPAGATTHSLYGVRSVEKISLVLDCMQTIGMPLLIHGESTDPHVDVFDREKVFIDATLVPLLKQFPSLKVVLEHITTEQAASFIEQDTSGRLAATITPQHLVLNRNSMFSGGIQPHNYCLPVLKRERHRLALRRVATSGHKSFFLGTDSAPHTRSLKQTSCGCAGIFNAPVALEVYAAVFDEEHALDKLESFCSLNGPNFYGLSLNAGTVTLIRRPSVIPLDIELPGGAKDSPFPGRNRNRVATRGRTTN